MCAGAQEAIEDIGNKNTTLSELDSAEDPKLNHQQQ